MSSDNGVYVGRFLNPSGEPKYEYRVIEAAAIENCEDKTDPALTKAFLTVYYAGARPIYNEHDANVEAQEMYNRIVNEDFSLCEYGICVFIYDIILDLDIDAARKYIDDFFGFNDGEAANNSACPDAEPFDDDYEQLKEDYDRLKEDYDKLKNKYKSLTEGDKYG